MQTRLNDFLHVESFKAKMAQYGKEGPFDHVVIDDFFSLDVATQLESEFPNFDDDVWHTYNNAIEVKKVCNDWNFFPKLTYMVFNALNSVEFMSMLKPAIGDVHDLYADPGLNGGGWHIHARSGKLNTHLDYSLHPKLGLQRKLNIIIYLNSQWSADWGGSLGFWSNESPERPGELVKSVMPLFNRAVIFDTTQNSWHGLPDAITCPEQQHRKSLAAYYLCSPPIDVDPRGKALFAPSSEQENDAAVLELIRQRANVKTASSVYK